MRHSTATVIALLFAASCSARAPRVSGPASAPINAAAPGAAAPAVVDVEPAPAGPTLVPAGRVLFVDHRGAIVMVSVATGVERRFAVEGATATELALSPDGRQLAFIAQRTDPRTPQITVLDLAQGIQRPIEHEHVELVRGLKWAGGTLLYGTYEGRRKGGEHRGFAVARGANAGRRVASNVGFEATPDGSRVVSIECADAREEWTCAQRLLVDAVAGGGRKVLADERRFELVALTPDGRQLLTLDQLDPRGTDLRFTRRDLDGQHTMDLGVATVPELPQMFGAAVSASSQEAIVRRGTATLAVKLDGSGERTIARGRIMAGFIDESGVLYTETKDLGGYGGDVRNDVSSLWLLRGERRTRIADFADCGTPAFSRSARLAARVCRDGIHVYSLETAEELRSIRPFEGAMWPVLLGFDERDAGLVVAIGPDSALPHAEHDLRYLGLDGRDRKLGVAHSHVGPNEQATWPAFAFWPSEP